MLHPSLQEIGFHLCIVASCRIAFLLVLLLYVLRLVRVLTSQEHSEQLVYKAVTLLSSTRSDDCSTCICATWDARSASGQETLGSFAGLGELERAHQVLDRFFAPLAP